MFRRLFHDLTLASSSSRRFMRRAGSARTRRRSAARRWLSGGAERLEPRWLLVDPTTEISLVGGNLTIEDIDYDDVPVTSMIIDNDRPGYDEPGFVGLGPWNYWNYNGYGNNHLASDNFTVTADYLFTNLRPGERFQVSATWTTFYNRTSGARYTITGAGDPVVGVADQRLEPADFFANGVGWKRLGIGEVGANGTLRVFVTNPFQYRDLIADAVRIDVVRQGTKDDTLSLGVDRTDPANPMLVLSDPVNVLRTSIVGATGSLTNTVRVPLNAIGNEIRFDLGLGNDVVTLDLLSSGALNKSFELRMRGGNDGLVVIGPGASTSATARPGSLTGDGTLTLTAPGSTDTVRYFGLEAIDLVNLQTVSVRLPGSDDTLALTGGTTFYRGAQPALRLTGQTRVSGVLTPIVPIALRDHQTLDIDTTSPDGQDSITIGEAAGTHGIQSMRIVTGTGTDRIEVASGGGLAMTGSLQLSTAGSIVARGPLAIGGSLLATAAGAVELSNFSAADASLQGSRIELQGTSYQVQNGDLLFSSATTLNAPAPISIRSTAPAGRAIRFQATLDGVTPLELTAGLADIVFQQPVGNTTPLGGLTIHSAAAVDFLQTVRTSGNLRQVNGSGTTTFRGGSIGRDLQVATSTILVNTGVLSANVSQAGLVQLIAEQAITLNTALQANAGRIDLRANQDGAGSESLTIGPNVTLTTSNNTAEAMRLAANTATGGTGAIRLRPVATGANGRVTILAEGGDLIDAASAGDGTPGLTLVTAAEADLRARSAGTATNPLRMAVNRVVGRVGDGTGLYLQNVRDLTVGGLNPLPADISGLTAVRGPLQLIATGALSIDEPLTVTQGSLLLNADGDDTLLSVRAAVAATEESRLLADKMRIEAPVSVPQAILHLQPESTRDTADAIVLGSLVDTAVDTLELSAAELDRLNAQVVRIGNQASTSIEVRDAIDLRSQPNVVERLVLTGTTVNTTAGGISVSSLAVLSGGVAHLGTSDVDRFAVQAQSSVILQDGNEVTIGTVEGLSGVRGTSVNLTATTRLRVENTSAETDLEASGTLTILLNGSDGTFELAAGSIAAAGTSGVAGGATITADEIDLAGSLQLPGQDLLVQPFRAGQALILGANPGTVGTLELSDEELDRINQRMAGGAVGRLTLGNPLTGNIRFLGPISPAGTDSLWLRTGGAVSDANQADPDLAIPALFLSAQSGIGSALPGDSEVLELAVTRLDVNNAQSGGVRIDNRGALRLVDLDGVANALLVGGGMIRATSPLSIETPQSPTGNFAFIAADDPLNAGDQLTISASISHSGSPAVLTLQAGDDVLHAAGLISSSDEVRILADHEANGTDGDRGRIQQLAGQLIAPRLLLSAYDQIDYAQSQNDVNRLAGRLAVPGTFVYRDEDDLELGTVGFEPEVQTAGIQAPGGQVSLTFATTRAGNLFSAAVDQTADLVAQQVSLFVGAAGGQVGNASLSPLELNADQLTIQRAPTISSADYFLFDSNQGLSEVLLDAGQGKIEIEIRQGNLLSADSSVDLIGDSARIVVTDGSVGATSRTPGNALQTSVRTLSVNTSVGDGSQFLLETDDLEEIDLVAGEGDVFLSAGRILSSDTARDLQARRADLLSASAMGGVGTGPAPGAALQTAVDELTIDTTLYSQPQFIWEADGLTEFQLLANLGSIRLTTAAAGSLLSSDTVTGSGTLDLTASTAQIVLANGQFGATGPWAGQAIETRVDHLVVDTAAGSGDQFIREAATLQSLDLRAGSGQITLWAAGAIHDNDSAIDISAQSLVATAALGLGQRPSWGRPLDTQVSRVSLTNLSSGDIQLDNRAASPGSLELVGVTQSSSAAAVSISNRAAAGSADRLLVSGNVLATASGTTVTLSSQGPLTVSPDTLITSHGPLLLQGLDSIASGDTINIGSRAAITSLAGSLQLLAGDDLLLASDAMLTAQSDVILRSDVNNLDPIAASHVLLEGSVTSQQGRVWIETGSGNDQVTIVGPLRGQFVSGSPLPGDAPPGNVAPGIIVQTSAGDDQVRIDSNGMSVSGGTVDQLFADLLIRMGLGRDSLLLEDTSDATGDLIDINHLLSHTVSGLVSSGARITYDGQLESLEVSTSAVSADQISIAPSQQTAVALRGGGPVSEVGGDSLVYQASATKQLTGRHTGQLSTPGYQPVNYAQIERLSAGLGSTFADTISLSSLEQGQDGQPNHLQVQLDATRSWLELSFAGQDGPLTILSTQSASSMTSLQIAGSSDDDLVTLNFAPGFFPLAVLYAGAGQTPSRGDQLAILGDEATTRATYQPDASTSRAGQVRIDSGGSALTTVDFVELEPLDITGMVQAKLALPTPGGQLSIVNDFDFTQGRLQPALHVSGTTGSGATVETAAFWNNASLLITAAAGSGNETVIVHSADNLHRNHQLTIDLGSGTDLVRLDGALRASGAVTIHSGGSIRDGLDDTTADILTDGPIRLTAGRDIAGPSSPPAAEGRLEIAALTTTQLTLEVSSTEFGKIAIASAHPVLLQKADARDGSLEFVVDGSLTVRDLTAWMDRPANTVQLTARGPGADLLLHALQAGSMATATLIADDDILDNNLSDANRVVVGTLVARSSNNRLDGSDGIRLQTSVAKLDAEIASVLPAAVWIENQGALDLVRVVSDAGPVEITTTGRMIASDVRLTHALVPGTLNLQAAEMEVDSIQAIGSSQVNLRTVSGGLDDADGDSLITADRLSFASAGSVGASSAIRLRVREVVSGTTTGAGVIRLNQPQDALLVTSLITADGSLSVQTSAQLTALDVRSLTDRVDNDISLVSSSAGIEIRNVWAGALGDVTLAAVGGSLLGLPTPDDQVRAAVLTLTAAGAVSLQTAVSRLTGNTTTAGAVSLQERDTISVDALSTAQGPISIVAGGSLTAVSVRTAASSHPSNGILLRTTVGSILIDSIDAGPSGEVVLQAADAILESGDDGSADVIAARARFDAQTGIGTSQFIETKVDELDIRNQHSGAILIDNLTSLRLIDLDPVRDNLSVDAVQSSVQIWARGPLTILSSARTAGDTTYAAWDDGDDGLGTGGVSLADNLLVADGVLVQTSLGELVLRAGDRLEIARNANLVSAQKLSLVVDLPFSSAGQTADPDSGGGTLLVHGSLSSGTSDIRMTTGDQDDLLVIDNNAGSLGDGGTLHGLLSPLLIQAGLGADRLRLDDSGESQAANLVITNDGAGAGTVTGLAPHPFRFTGIRFFEAQFGSAGNPAAAETLDIAPNLFTTFELSGRDPSFMQTGVDTLRIDLPTNNQASVDMTGPAAGAWSFTGGLQPIHFSGFERLSANRGLFAITVDMQTAGFADGLTDQIDVRLSADGREFEVDVNGAPLLVATDRNVASFALSGSNDAEILRLIETLGGIPGDSADGLNGFTQNAPAAHDNDAFRSYGRGPSPVALLFAAAGGDDQLIVQTRTPRTAAYFSDRVASGNSGLLQVAAGTRGWNLAFSQLEASEFHAAGGTLLVDATANDDVTQLTISNRGGLSSTDGFNRIDADASSFSGLAFGGFAELIVRSGNGSDRITLASLDAADPDGPGAEGVNPASPLTRVTLSGDNTTGSDAAADTFDLLRLPSTITLTILGDDPANPNPVADTITIGNQTADVGLVFDGTLDPLAGPIFLIGDALGLDRLTLDDSGDLTGDRDAHAGIIGNAFISGLNLGATLSYERLAVLRLILGNDSDQLLIQSTAAGTVYRLELRGGADAVSVGSTMPDVSNSLLNGIQGMIELDSGTGADSLLLSDQGDLRGDTYRFRLSGSHTELEFSDGSPDGAATPEIRFLSSSSGQLEQFTLQAGQGNDRFTNLTQDGGSRLQTNMLATASNRWLGGAGADLFELAWAAGYQLPAMQEVQLDGGSPSSMPTQRDRVRLYLDATGDGARQIGVQYGALDRGDLNVSGLRANGVIPLLGLELLEYYGDAALDDEVSVRGPASGDATFSVTPLSAHAANLFLGGAPRLSAVTSASANQPGIAGGSAATDLHFRGLRTQADATFTPGGLHLFGGNNSRLVVNASTEEIQGVSLSAAWNAAGQGGVGTAIRSTGQAFDQLDVTDSRVRIRRLDSLSNPLEDLLEVRFDPLTFQRDNPLEPEVIVNTGAEATFRTGSRLADDVTVQLSSLTRFQILGGQPSHPQAYSLDGDHLLVRSSGTLQVSSEDSGPLLVITGPSLQPLLYEEIERLTVLPENGILQVFGDASGTRARDDRFVLLGEDVDQFLDLDGAAGSLSGDTDGANELRLLMNQQQLLAATGIQLIQLFGLDGADTLIAEPWANHDQGWGVELLFDGGAGKDRLRYGYVEPLPELDRVVDGSLRGISEHIVLTGSNTIGTGRVQATRGATSATILQADFMSLEDISFDFNDTSAGDDDRLTIAGTTQADEVWIDFSRAGTWENPWVSYGPAASPRFTVSQFVRWSATSTPVASSLPQLALALQAGDDLVQFTTRTNANPPLAPTLLSVDGGSSFSGDQISITGTTSANDTFRYVPGAIGTGQLEVTRALAPLTTILFNQTERINIDGGGGLGTDTLTVVGTELADLIDLSATTFSGGTVQLGNTPQLAFDRFGYGSLTNASAATSRIILQSLDGSDSISLQHRAGWQISEIAIDAGGQPSEDLNGDTISLTTSDEADEVQFDALTLTSGTFVVQSGGTSTRITLLNVESALLDMADPSTTPGDLLSANVLLTPGTDRGSGSSTVTTLLPLQYRHVEVATPITGSVLQVEGTDGDDVVTMTIEDLDQDGQIDEPVLRINGVPFDLRGYSDVILDTKGGNDRITLIPTVGERTIVLRDGLTIRGGSQGAVGDTFVLHGVGAGLAAVSVQQMERISIYGRDDVDLLTATRDRVYFEQAGIRTELIIDPLHLQRLTAVLLGGDDVADFSQLTRPVELWGGDGNDILRGGSSTDQLYGEGGNDQLQGGPGRDEKYGGQGSDLFVWNAGDGTDLLEGAAGIDRLTMVGNPGADSFTLSGHEARLMITRTAPGDITATISAAEIEQLDLNTNVLGSSAAATLGGEDQFTILDLSATDLRVLQVGLGGQDDEVDTVTVYGRPIADELLIQADDAGVQIAGLRHSLRISGAVHDEDRLLIYGQGGDDRVNLADLSAFFSPSSVRTYGGEGNDILSGFGLLYGESGNDQLTGDEYDQTLDGGPGADRLDGAGGQDRLFGQSGDDLLLASPGNDRYDGGTGFDTILLLGTPDADSLFAYQSSATQLQLTTNQAVSNHTLVAGTVERLQFEAGDAEDQLLVRWHDLLHSEIGWALPVHVMGASGAMSADRLTIVDDGVIDAAILRTGLTPGEGHFTLGPANNQPFTLTYANLSQLTLVDANGVPLDPGVGNGARVTLFQPDTLEPNNHAELATSLGTLTGMVERAGTIDPAGDPSGGQAADVDWFRFQAPYTGLIDIALRFEEVALRAGRAGLPGQGNLDLHVYNASGSLLAGNGPSFGTNDGPAEINADGEPDGEDERIRMPMVKDAVYLVRVSGRTSDAINAYQLTFTPFSAPTPQQLQLRTAPDTFPSSDTGRSNSDQITQRVRPTLLVQVDDAFLRNDLPRQDSSGPRVDEMIPIPFPNSHAPGYRIAIFQHGPSGGGTSDGTAGGADPGATSSLTPVGFASPTDSEGWYAFTLPTNLSDGTHQFSARVQMIEPIAQSGNPSSPAVVEPVSGYGPASDRLSVVVDTVIPPLSLGSPANATDGLLPESGDTGIEGDPATFSDRITSDRTPSLWGYTEPQAIVRVYVDRNGDRSINAEDLLIGSMTAPGSHLDSQIPPLGAMVAWNLTPTIALDDPRYFAASGARTLLVVAEDLAGNISSLQTIRLFLDTTAPVVTGIQINRAADPYSLFDPIPTTDSFTPPVRSLVISIKDGDPRDASDSAFLHTALHTATALSPARYSLVGLQHGLIPLAAVEWSAAVSVAGQPATGTLTLRFAQPLPDDRYTLTLDDLLRDAAGNRLDGESNAEHPRLTPTFPSGDGTPGGSFVARFNIDSRVELAAARGSQVLVDANGNFIFDPQYPDPGHRDLVFSVPQATDLVFAGNWAAPAATAASGFDKLGVYGLADSVYRFLLDTDDNGSLDFSSVNSAPFQIPGKPISGDFAPQHPGDEIGLWDARGLRWILDSDGNQRLQAGDLVLLLDLSTYPELVERRDLEANLFPLVGDFNGDGSGDLTLFDPTQNRFHLDLNRDGRRDAVLEFGIPGNTERPVSGDWNLDGVDDLGVVTHDPSASSASEPAAAFWSILVSDVGTQTLPAPPARLFAAYSPAPVGNDLFASFGSVRHQPLLGNFVTILSANAPGGEPGGEPSGSPYTHPLRPLDVNNDGWVTAQDALRLINALNRLGSGPLPLLLANEPQDRPPNAYLDVTQDEALSPLDVLQVINALNRIASAQGNASNMASEGEGLGEGEQVPDSLVVEVPVGLERDHHPIAPGLVVSLSDRGLVIREAEQQGSRLLRVGQNATLRPTYDRAGRHFSRHFPPAVPMQFNRIFPAFESSKMPPENAPRLPLHTSSLEPTLVDQFFSTRPSQVQK